MKANKYEELMYLSAIGEICEAPEELYFEDFICFKPGKIFSQAQALYLTKKEDERDYVIEARLNSFQKKMGLDEVVSNSCGMTRLKSLVISYMLKDKDIAKKVRQNCANNLRVMEERKILTEEQATAMNKSFGELVDNLQKSYDEQIESNF